MSLPILLDEFDAIEYFNNELSDAHKAYTIAYLSKYYSNKQIRDALKIKNNYTVSQFKTAGLKLTDEELELWDKNSNRISLGHIRAIVKYKEPERDTILRDILSKKLSVRHVESLTKTKEENSADIERYEREMALQLGYAIKIKYDPNKKVGSMTLPFYSYENLEDIADKLGYKSDEYY
jgi:hypothetical protein